MNKNVSMKTVITFAGAVVAFLIGSGFATGQEVLQYFASYGYWGIAGALLTLVLLIYVCSSFLVVGRRENFERGSDIYKYYCGNKLGIFFDYFSTFFCFLSFTVMISGAGATLNQHYELPVYVGGILIAVLALITVLMGLSRIVDVIGKIGPAIVIISILLGVVSIFQNFGNLGPDVVLPALEELEASGSLMKASTNWGFAAFSYVGFCMLWLAGFLASMGAKAQSEKEASLGGVWGASAFAIAVIIVALGLLGCIKVVAGSQIPNLHLAKNIHPALASVFAVIIIAGIYTTAVPLLWNVSSRFTKDGSKNFRILTVVLALVGAFIGLALPFAKLVNIVYVINGYVGAVLLFIMFGRSLIKIFGKKESKVKSEDMKA
ncbi:YkvI family membrane protein [Clostridium culturomicium]|uniref:YkvI family membrane protein n=1 Tax=Clostridium culturomicium TaxID=1499683 RepID=UPI003857CA16